MADKIVVVREKRHGCGCMFALALLAGIGVAVYGWYRGESRSIERRASYERARKSPAPALPAASKPAAPAPDASALPGWFVAMKRDDMTDELACYFALDGIPIEDGAIEYVPRLIVKAVPASTDPLKYSASVAVKIKTEGMKRNAQDVTYRFGTRPAVNASLETSEDRRAIILPGDALSSLDGCPTFALRFTTTLGATRTLRFTTQGFTIAAFEEELRRQLRAAK